MSFRFPLAGRDVVLIRVSSFPFHSATAYSEAIAIAEMCGLEDTSLPSALRIVERTLRLERTASASTICSVMLQRKVRFIHSFTDGLILTSLFPSCCREISLVHFDPRCKRSGSGCVRSATPRGSRPLLLRSVLPRRPPLPTTTCSTLLKRTSKPPSPKSHRDLKNVRRHLASAGPTTESLGASLM